MSRILKSVLFTFIVISGFIASSFISSITAKDLSNLVPIDAPITVIPTGCIVTGCSNELCVDEKYGHVDSTCQWKEEYSCLPNAICERQSDNSCGWTYTEKYNECRGVNLPTAPVTPTPTPTQTPKIIAVCGNTICETGEADTTSGGCDPSASSLCLGPPLTLKSGTCPTDCPSQKPYKPTTTPTPTLLPTISIVSTTSVPKVTFTPSPSLTPFSNTPPTARFLRTVFNQTNEKVKSEMTTRYSSKEYLNNVSQLPPLYVRIIKHIHSLFLVPSSDTFFFSL